MDIITKKLSLNQAFFIKPTCYAKNKIEEVWKITKTAIIFGQKYPKNMEVI